MYRSISSPASNYGLTEVRPEGLGNIMHLIAYPCPPATPTTIYEKAEGVSFTCVFQP